MEHLQRQFWVGISLGVVSLAASYTLTLLLQIGPEAFAAPVSCTARDGTCNCATQDACENGTCAGKCPACAGK